MPDDAARDQAVESIALIASWSSWDNMRHNSGYSAADATRVMEFAILGLLNPQPGVKTPPSPSPSN